MREIYLEKVPSTNDYAKEHVDGFPKGEIVCIWTDNQTEGRGQYGRSWKSVPKANLVVSFCIFTNKDPLFMTRMMAEICVKILSQLGVEAKIKWPNDLLVNGKKIAGILTETKGEWVIIGLGLNVNMTDEDLTKIDQPATSLLVETKQKYEINSILTLIKKELDCLD